MRRLLSGLILVLTSVILSSCWLDVNDSSHDNEYVIVSTYYIQVKDSFDVIMVYYIPKIDGEIIFYDLDDNTLEIVGQTNLLTYQLRGNYSIQTLAPLNIYMGNKLVWNSIPEIGYIYSETKLNSDVLVIYGTLPVISKTYEINDTIRVTYQENNLSLCYILARESTKMFVKYGDIRELL